MKGIAEIVRDCLELPVSQRLELVRVLLDVSDPDPSGTCGVDDAWDDEIGARISAVREGQIGSQSVDEFLSELERRRLA